MSALISFGEPLIFMSAVQRDAREHLFARRAYRPGMKGRQQAEAAKLAADIDARLPVGQANLKEPGYGG